MADDRNNGGISGANNGASGHEAFGFGSDREAEKKPNVVKATLGKVAAKIRADRDMLEVLEAFASFEPDAIEKCTVEEARRQPTAADAVKAVLRNQNRDPSPQKLVPGVITHDLPVIGAIGDLNARVYQPLGAGSDLPVILYFHGGGWVIANLDVYDASARGLCAQTGAIVLSVDYRQAPEHRFPAAWDDALASYRWLLRYAEDIGGDPQRIALAGESAGGTLAIATALAARDAGLQVPAHLLAIYPVTQTESTSTASYIENAVAQPLNRAMIDWFLDKLLRNEEDRFDPRLNLLKADLVDLPPVTLINAQLDPLRSDGALFEEALKAAGVPVMRQDYSGVAHEFFGMAAVVEKARLAQQLASERLQQSFQHARAQAGLQGRL